MRVARRREHRIPDSIQFLARPHAPVTGNTGRVASSPPRHRDAPQDRDWCRNPAGDEIPLPRGCALSSCLHCPQESVPRCIGAGTDSVYWRRIYHRSQSSRVASARAVFRSRFWGAKHLSLTQWTPCLIPQSRRFGQSQRSTTLIRFATSSNNCRYINDLRYRPSRPQVSDAGATVAILTSLGPTL